MRIYSLIAILPLAYAAAIDRDDINVLCGAPPSMPDSDFPGTDYNWPIGMLMDAGSKRLHVEGGPSRCVQAACPKGGGAGVYLCNDNPGPVDIQYGDVAFFAQLVARRCRHTVGDTDYVRKGQAFYPDNWNVILSDVNPCTAWQRP
ncbi:hypothetical protein F4779DRAFT_631888 [Xylariaceae sp. FL0662B]|nr:hypothetical protein F4779DRAFT_631888 [Xylariaceae sp. FL0662B]